MRARPHVRRSRLLPSLALLAACSAPAGDDGSDPSGLPEFTGNRPGAGVAGTPGAVAPGGAAPGGAAPGGAAPGAAAPSAPVAGAGSAPVSEGSPTGQIPVDTSSNASNGGTPAANGGAAGAPTMGNDVGAPTGAAGASMQPPAQPAPAEPAPAEPAPAPSLPTPPGAAFFFDDFESGAPGTQPAAWERWINYSDEAGNAADNPQFALLDDTVRRGGAQSVHFHTEAATQPAMLTFALPAGISSVHIRAFVMSRIAVGGVAADQVSNHESLIGLRAVHNDGNDEIRFGGAKGALGFNAVGPGRNDAVAPPMNLWGSAPGMQPGQWHCVEIAFINDGTPRATATLDGTVVRDVTSPQGWHIPVSNQWLDGLYKEVMIGWQSFSVAPANDVWMDDVVLSEQPIGCN